MFYLRAFIMKRLNVDDCFTFVLFFAHQCNSTTTIVKALVNIVQRMVEKDDAKGSSDSFYHQLVKECCSVKHKIFNAYNKDVGAGSYNRFQPSNCKILNEVQVQCAVTHLRMLFNDLSNSMSMAKDTQSKYKLVLHALNLIKDECEILPGIGKFRGAHLLQLSTLVGLLPFEYYVYIPLHPEGGTGNFLKETLKLSDYLSESKGTPTRLTEEVLLDWTVAEMKHMQNLFSLDYTGNLNENLHCILGRNSQKKDVGYQLPWYDHCSNTLTPRDIQLAFRVSGQKKNKFLLEAYDGSNVFVFLRNAGVLTKKKPVVTIEENTMAVDVEFMQLIRKG